MKKNKEPFPIRQVVEELVSENTLFADGLDDAIIGWLKELVLMKQLYYMTQIK